MHKRSFSFLLTLLVLATLACNALTGDDPTPTPDQRGPGESPTPGEVEAIATSQASLPPTPEPTTPPQPTRTVDPNLDEWTVMVYLDADNNLELPALFDMNEMEAAGSSDEVNVIVQIDRVEGETDADGDWTDTRRYEIQSDDDLSRINSLLVMEMGELNMGDPDVLTDFLVWSITNYPAQRYALVLWDHGAGWIGIAFDDSSPGGDGITMVELAQSLESALGQTGVDRLDLIGFDACLMGQMEVYQTVQPFAHYAVGSEELVPGLGWDYEAALGRLYGNPSMDAAEWSTYLVDDFIQFYTEVEPDDFVTMSAVDLTKWPSLTTALDDLSMALADDPQFISSAVGDARGSAEAYALIYPEDAEYYAAIDLWHFASILSQRSPDETVSAAAQRVMEMVDEVVVAEKHGAGFKYSRGISIYFPRTVDLLAETYIDETPIARWNDFLASYHGLGLVDIPSPEFFITYVLDGLVGVQKPAYMEVEITGRDIDNVVLIGGRYEADGSLRLLEYDYLIPEPTYLPDGSQIYEWRDGIHEDFFVWQTTSTYLYDSNNGDFVVMWPTSYDSPLYSVVGRYRRANSNQYFDANLVFDTSSGEFESVWTYQAEAKSSPNEIFPEPGDEFQVYDQYFGDNGDLDYQPGLSVVFDENRRVYYGWLPLTSGDYFLGFSAETIAGETADAFEDYTVVNDGLIPGYQAYLDPYKGFQFLYPDDWYAPSYDSVQLYTSDIEGETYLYITLYPGIGQGTAQDLKEQTLETFGGVDILYEDQVTVGGAPALRTAYGYQGNDGPQTGIFLTFVSGDTGYVVDLDGPSSAEDANIVIMQQLVDSWVFQPAGFGLQPANWATLDLPDFSVTVPSDFTYEELDSGWQLFSSADALSFVALRGDPLSGSDPAGIVQEWVGVAGDEVINFTAGDPYRYPLGSTAWARVDFSYTHENGTAMRGFLMGTNAGNRDIVAWAEAPSDVFAELEASVFLLAISDLNLADAAGNTSSTDDPEAPVGGGYVQTFDSLGNWGSGANDDAEAGINNGVYDFLVTNDEAIYWVLGGEQFGDGSYEVDATQVSGPLDNGYGMMLRVDSSDSFYLLEVSGDGYIWIGRCDNGCSSVDQLIQGGWFASPAVNQGLNATNGLRVEARGSSLTFFVNGQQVGFINNATIANGDIGFLVETLGEGNVRIAFDNFRFTPAEEK